MPGGGRSMATEPFETHLHRSFNWENGAPGPQEGPRERPICSICSAEIGNQPVIMNEVNQELDE